MTELDSALKDLQDCVTELWVLYADLLAKQEKYDKAIKETTQCLSKNISTV